MNETQPLPTDAERALFEAEWLKVTGETASTWDAVCARAGEPVPAHVAGRYFARATHAAWLIWQAARRTPAPVGVEPVAHSVGRTLKWHDGKGVTNAQLYTADQMLAMGRRFPLTDAQIEDLLKIGNPSDEEKRLIRIGWEAAINIKGGQRD